MRVVLPVDEPSVPNTGFEEGLSGTARKQPVIDPEVLQVPDWMGEELTNGRVRREKPRQFSERSVDRRSHRMCVEPSPELAPVLDETVRWTRRLTRPRRRLPSGIQCDGHLAVCAFSGVEEARERRSVRDDVLVQRTDAPPAREQRGGDGADGCAGHSLDTDPIRAGPSSQVVVVRCCLVLQESDFGMCERGQCTEIGCSLASSPLEREIVDVVRRECLWFRIHWWDGRAGVFSAGHRPEPRAREVDSAGTTGVFDCLVRDLYHAYQLKSSPRASSFERADGRFVPTVPSVSGRCAVFVQDQNDTLRSDRPYPNGSSGLSMYSLSCLSSFVVVGRRPSSLGVARSRPPSFGHAREPPDVRARSTPATVITY